MENNNVTNEKANGKKKFNIVYLFCIIIVVIMLVVLIFSGKTKSVSFNTPGYVGDKINSQTINDTVNGTLITEPVLDLSKKPYYKFLGWFDNPEGTGQPIDFSTHLFKDNTVLYTVFAPIDYELNFDYDGGSLEDGKSNPTTYNVETTVFNIIEPTLEGKVFDGWMVITESNEIGQTKYNTPDLIQFLLNKKAEPSNLIIKATWK